MNESIREECESEVEKEKKTPYMAVCMYTLLCNGYGSPNAVASLDLPGIDVETLP